MIAVLKPNSLVDGNGLSKLPLGLLTRVLAVALACVLLLEPTCFGQPPTTAEQSQIEGFNTKKPMQSERFVDLVGHLSHSEFAIRENANELLASQLTDADLPQLDAFIKSTDDLESKIRLAGISAKIKFERQQIQVRSFIRSRDASQTFGFHGWRSFSRYSGTSRSAKLLFLKLMDAYPELVEKELESNQEAIKKARAITSVVFENRRSGRQSEIEDGLALLYCINAAEELFTKELEPDCVHLFSMSPFSTFLRETPSRKPLEQMLTAWAMRCTITRLNCLLLFMQNEMSQSRELAKSLLATNEAKTEPIVFQLSMQALYQFGTQEDLPLIEPWLDDRTVMLADGGNAGPGLQNGPPAIDRMTVEYRDVALLLAMRLSRDDLTKSFPFLRTHYLRGFYPESIGLPDNMKELRTKRIDEWRLNQRSMETTATPASR